MKKTMLSDENVQKKLRNLKTTLSKNGLKPMMLKSSEYEIYEITLSRQGFSELTYSIMNEHDIDLAMSIDLKNIIGLNSFYGFVDLGNSFIEVIIKGANTFGLIDTTRLFGPNDDNIRLTSFSKPIITIGASSELCKKLTGIDHGLSFYLHRVNPTSTEEAERLIRHYSSQVFFDILEKRNIGLRIMRRIKNGYRSRTKLLPDKEMSTAEYSLPYPDSILPFVPVSLVTSAVDSLARPSFQFLLCYQAIEFFLLRANKKEALSEISEILIDKEFDPTNEFYLKKLLDSIKPQWVNPTKGEVEQLCVLLSDSHLLADIRHFLKSNPEIKTHISKKHKFSQIEINLEMNDKTFASCLAKRVYNIRNAIVHSKEDESGKLPMLLLETSDEEIVDFDAALLFQIAKRVIKILGNDGML